MLGETELLPCSKDSVRLEEGWVKEGSHCCRRDRANACRRLANEEEMRSRAHW